MALARALHGRLQGTKFPAGVSVKVPEIHRLTWKPSRMADKTTVYAFAWCEGCTLDVLRADIGLCYYLLPFSLILLTPRIRCPKISAPKIVHNDNFHEGVVHQCMHLERTYSEEFSNICEVIPDTSYHIIISQIRPSNYI